MKFRLEMNIPNGETPDTFAGLVLRALGARLATGSVESVPDRQVPIRDAAGAYLGFWQMTETPSIERGYGQNAAEAVSSAIYEAQARQREGK